MEKEIIRKPKKTISARIDEEILELANKQDLPMSQILEAGLISFLKLKEDERLPFIAENSAELTNPSELIVSEMKWNEFLEMSVGTTKFKDILEIALLAKKTGKSFNYLVKSLNNVVGVGGITTIGILGIASLFSYLNKNKN